MSRNAGKATDEGYPGAGDKNLTRANPCARRRRAHAAETSTLRRPLLRRPVAGARPGEEAGRLAGVSRSDSTLNERADIVEEAPTVGLQIIRDEVAGRGSRRFGSVACGSTIWANHFRPHSLVDSVDKPLLGILGRHGTARTGLGLPASNSTRPPKA